MLQMISLQDTEDQMNVLEREVVHPDDGVSPPAGKASLQDVDNFQDEVVHLKADQERGVGHHIVEDIAVGLVKEGLLEEAGRHIAPELENRSTRNQRAMKKMNQTMICTTLS